MKRIALLGLLLLLSSGCGRGWLPTRRGAACNGSCLTSAPIPASAGCNDCVTGYGAGYSGYDSGEIIGDSGYYGSTVTGGYDGQIINSGTMVPPSMAP